MSKLDEKQLELFKDFYYMSKTECGEKHALESIIRLVWGLCGGMKSLDFMPKLNEERK